MGTPAGRPELGSKYQSSWVRATVATLLPEPMRFFSSFWLVPSTMETMAMMLAMPMITPKTVRRERSLWLQTPRSEVLIFSNMRRLLSQNSSKGCWVVVRTPSRPALP